MNRVLPKLDLMNVEMEYTPSQINAALRLARKSAFQNITVGFTVHGKNIIGRTTNEVKLWKLKTSNDEAMFIIHRGVADYKDDSEIQSLYQSLCSNKKDSMMDMWVDGRYTNFCNRLVHLVSLEAYVSLTYAGLVCDSKIDAAGIPFAIPTFTHFHEFIDKCTCSQGQSATYCISNPKAKKMEVSHTYLTENFGDGGHKESSQWVFEEEEDDRTKPFKKLVLMWTDTRHLNQSLNSYDIGRYAKKKLEYLPPPAVRVEFPPGTR